MPLLATSRRKAIQQPIKCFVVRELRMTSTGTIQINSPFNSRKWEIGVPFVSMYTPAYVREEVVIGTIIDGANVHTFDKLEDAKRALEYMVMLTDKYTYAIYGAIGEEWVIDGTLIQLNDTVNGMSGKTFGRLTLINALELHSKTSDKLLNIINK